MAMTITLSHLNSVASARMIMMEVLALPASSVNFRSSNYNQNHNNNYIQCSWRSTVPSRLVTTVPNSNQFSCSSYTYNYSTSSAVVEEEDYDSNYNNNNADLFAEKFTMMKPTAARNSPIRRSNFVNMLSRILASFLSYGLLFGFTIAVHSLYARNSALAASYDRMGGSLSSSSSLTSSSCSCSCNCQNTSPSIHIINMASPHSLQSCASLAITILAHLCGILQPLLNQLMMSRRHGSVLLFQVAVSDKKRALRRKLTKIAKYADTSTLDGLNYVLKEVVNALLQCNDSSFHFTNLHARYNSMESLSKRFQEFLNRELETHGKHENTLRNVDGIVKYKKDSMVKANSSIENEYTVVTVLVLATSKHSISSFKENDARYLDSIEVLQTLKRIPKNEIQSVEVLWSPQKKDEVLLEDDLVRYFHRLIRIEKGRIRLK